MATVLSALPLVRLTGDARWRICKSMTEELHNDATGRSNCRDRSGMRRHRRSRDQSDVADNLASRPL